MADKKAPPEEVVPVVSRYPIEELSANAEALFSVRPEVLAGALFGIDAKELSVAEAQNFIQQFLERKVN